MEEDDEASKDNQKPGFEGSSKNIEQFDEDEKFARITVADLDTRYTHKGLFIPQSQLPMFKNRLETVWDKSNHSVDELKGESDIEELETAAKICPHCEKPVETPYADRCLRCPRCGECMCNDCREKERGELVKHEA